MSSLYLCSMPGFWVGVGRLLDFGNTYDFYNETANGAQADGIGIMMDWQAVRQDLWQSFLDYDPEIRSAEAKRRETQLNVTQR